MRWKIFLFSWCFVEKLLAFFLLFFCVPLAGIEACEKIESGRVNIKDLYPFSFAYLSMALLFFMCSERFFIRLLFLVVHRFKLLTKWQRKKACEWERKTNGLKLKLEPFDQLQRQESCWAMFEVKTLLTEIKSRKEVPMKIFQMIQTFQCYRERCSQLWDIKKRQIDGV